MSNRSGSVKTSSIALGIWSRSHVGQAAPALALPLVAGVVVVSGAAEVLPFRVGLDPMTPCRAAVFVGIAAGENPQRRLVESGDGEHQPGDLLRIACRDVLETWHRAG